MNDLLAALREEHSAILLNLDKGVDLTPEALLVANTLALCAIAEALTKLARAVEVNGAEAPAVRVMQGKES